LTQFDVTKAQTKADRRKRFRLVPHIGPNTRQNASAKLVAFLSFSKFVYCRPLQHSVGVDVTAWVVDGVKTRSGFGHRLLSAFGHRTCVAR
jgi:hypothetical protein